MKRISGITFNNSMLELLSACSVSKEAKSIKKTVNGDWILQTIDVEGINSKFKAKVFNEADFNCFIGSTWHFVSNNSMGSYTIPATTTGCDAITRKYTLVRL